jgi:predicted HD phosphohydrolase
MYHTQATGRQDTSGFRKASERILCWWNQSYWSKIAGVATRLSQLRGSTDLREAADFPATGVRLKEYDNLRGFAPFDSFVKSDEV